MKMRQRKKALVQSRKFILLSGTAAQGQFYPAPPVKTIYKVARAKDGVVVLETEDLAAANEAIEKAVRQKKAKLELVS